MRAAVLGGLGTGMVATLVTAAVLLSTTRFWSSSSTAPVGIIFVLPVLAALAGLRGALVGAALGVLVSGWRAGRSLRTPAMAASFLVFLGVSGWTLADFAPELVASTSVQRVEQMSEPELGRVLDRPLVGRNVFVLAAVAGNPEASSETLDRIARMPDPDLHDGTGTVLDAAQGKNTRMLSVMRLVASHPHVQPETLERLVHSPNPSVVVEAVSHPKLSRERLAPLAGTRDPAVLRGLARNPNSPPELLDRLSTDPQVDVRLGVAWNRGTSPETRKRLQADTNEHVRETAIGGIRAEATDTPLLIR